MRRKLLGVFGVVAGAVAVLAGNGGNRGLAVAGSHPLGTLPVQHTSSGGSNGSSGGGSNGSSGGTSPGSSGGSANTALPAGNKSVAGPVVQTPFGPVQVRVTFSGGKITDAQAVQTPSSHQQSVMINQYATPILHQETLKAQSANIDMISGATWTSEAYAQSLQAAIQQASK